MPFAKEFAALQPMQRELAQLNFHNKLKGVSEDPAVHDRVLEFDSWRATVSFGRPEFGFGDTSHGNPQPVGGAIIGELGQNEFLVSGQHCRVDFAPSVGKTLQRQFIRVEEGFYRDGSWKFKRILNGDQTDYGLNFGDVPKVLRVSLDTF